MLQVQPEWNSSSPLQSHHSLQPTQIIPIGMEDQRRWAQASPPFLCGGLPLSSEISRLSHQNRRKLVQTVPYIQYNSPNLEVENGELLTLELYSITLKGLSMVDFQLALRVNNIPFKKYSMFPIDNEKQYRLEASMIRMERQSEQLQQQFDEDMKDRPKKVQ